MAGTIAHEVAKRCEGATAYTLECGYAVKAGGNVRFPCARIEQARRNDRGRMVHCIARYPDGSALKFTYSDVRGSKLIELA